MTTFPLSLPRPPSAGARAFFITLTATALLGAGCGGTNDAGLDAGPGALDASLGDTSLPDAAALDQGSAASCDVNNGGCSTAPMVVCGLTTSGGVLCGACPTGYTGDGRVCTSASLVDECALNTHNCSPNATCTNTASAFTCTCASGFTGNGVDCVREGCAGPADCDDGVACTVDTCGPTGNCLHAPNAALCSTGALCHPVTGCVAGTICGSPADCVDSDPCTRNEVCSTATATCSFTLLDNDGDGEIPVVCGGTDCNDALGSVGAGADELCGNGRDDDCDGVIDNDATIASDPLTLLNSEANCGACGNACGLGESCLRGVCTPCGGSVGAPCCDTFCPSLSSCGGGTCNNGGGCVVSGVSATCSASCGALGEPCCPGSVCDLGGACASGVCTDPTMVQCPSAGAPVNYRLSVLHIPTPLEANNGNVVGHNVDDRGDVCGVPDYAGAVDNSLIDLAAALPALAPDDPINLQAEIDNAINCAPSAVDCTRLDLIVQVRTGTGCAVIEVLDGTAIDAQTLAGPFGVALDGAGNFSGQVASLALAIPYSTPTGSVDININLSGVRMSGTLTSNALSNVVLGGFLVQADFETTIMNLLPLLGGNITFDDIGPILANLYDVQLNGMCRALSVGFTASGPRLP
jgi:hypothetical protein